MGFFDLRYDFTQHYKDRGEVAKKNNALLLIEIEARVDLNLDEEEGLFFLEAQGCRVLLTVPSGRRTVLKGGPFLRTMVWCARWLIEVSGQLGRGYSYLSRHVSHGC